LIVPLIDNVNLNYVFGDPNAEPTVPNTGGSPKIQGFNLDEEIDSIEVMVWLMRNSKYFKNIMLAHAIQTIDKERALIEKRLPPKKIPSTVDEHRKFSKQ